MPSSHRIPPAIPERRLSKRLSSPYPCGRVIQPGDDPRMVEALLWLLRSRIRFERMTRHHVKIARINFFPTTGKITIDGGGSALPQSGLAALQALMSSTVTGVAPNSGADEASEPQSPATASEPLSKVALQAPSNLVPGVEPAQSASALAPPMCRRLQTNDTPPWED